MIKILSSYYTYRKKPPRCNFITVKRNLWAPHVDFVCVRETGPSLYGISSSSDSWFWLTQSGEKRNFFERDRVCCNGPLGPSVPPPPSHTFRLFMCGSWLRASLSIHLSFSYSLSVHPSVIQLFPLCPSICHSTIPYLSLPCSVSYFCLHICHSTIPYLSLPCSVPLSVHPSVIQLFLICLFLAPSLSLSIHLLFGYSLSVSSLLHLLFLSPHLSLNLASVSFLLDLVGRHFTCLYLFPPVCLSICR